MAVSQNGHKGTALIYCRTATTSQAAPTAGLDEQAETCTRYAESLGYEVGRITREVHSGNDLEDRPLLTRDRADLRAGQFQALIVSSPDRLTRRRDHLALIAGECAQAGVQLLFATGAPYIKIAGVMA